MDREAEVRKSLQLALLGEVAPNLRAVCVEFDEASVEIIAYFDGPIGEFELETISEVETEVIADLPDSNEISHQVKRLDFPSGIPSHHVCVYHRLEWMSHSIELNLLRDICHQLQETAHKELATYRRTPSDFGDGMCTALSIMLQMIQNKCEAFEVQPEDVKLDPIFIEELIRRG